MTAMTAAAFSRARSARRSACRRPGAGAKFRISLAEWSIHKAIRAHSLSNLDFRRSPIAMDRGLEFVNQLWEAPLQDYLER